MPLNTQIIRNSQPWKVPGGWSAWHLTKVIDAITDEFDGDEDAADRAWHSGEYRFKEGHTYQELEEYIWTRGGEPNTLYTFTIEPGDVFKSWYGR